MVNSNRQGTTGTQVRNIGGGDTQNSQERVRSNIVIVIGANRLDATSIQAINKKSVNVQSSQEMVNETSIEIGANMLGATGIQVRNKGGSIHRADKK